MRTRDRWLLACMVLLSLSIPAMIASRSGDTYSLPNTPTAPNPVVTGTTISSVWANQTLNDISLALTQSLSRSGGNMISALKLADGTLAHPGISFTSDTTSGMYRDGLSPGNLYFSVAGVQTLAMGVDGTRLVAKGYDVADGGVPAIVLDTTQSWTTQPLLSVRNLGVEKMSLSPSGKLTLGAGMAMNGDITMDTGSITMTSGGLFLTFGGITMTSGGIDMASGGISIASGDITIDAGSVYVNNGNVLVPNGHVSSGEFRAETQPVDGGTLASSTLTSTSLSSTAAGLSFSAGGVEVMSIYGTADAGVWMNMHSNRIVNLQDPTSSQEAATKQYVDNQISISQTWARIRIVTGTPTLISGNNVQGITGPTNNQFTVSWTTSSTSSNTYGVSYSGWGIGTGDETPIPLEHICTWVGLGQTDGDVTMCCRDLGNFEDALELPCLTVTDNTEVVITTTPNF